MKDKKIRGLITFFWSFVFFNLIIILQLVYLIYELIQRENRSNDLLGILIILTVLPLILMFSIRFTYNVSTTYVFKDKVIIIKKFNKIIKEIPYSKVIEVIHLQEKFPVILIKTTEDVIIRLDYSKKRQAIVEQYCNMKMKE